MIRVCMILFFYVSGVSLAQSSFSSERLQSAVENYVKKHSDDNAECVVANTIMPQKFAEENVTARCTTSETTLRGSTNVAIEFLVGEKVIRRVHVPVLIKKYAIVPIAIEAISQSSVVSENKISFEKREISSYGDENFPTEEEIVGASARRNIVKNSIITRSMLLSHNSVKRGADVVIYAGVSAVVVKTRGTALNDGDEGQTVRVLRDGTNEPLLCTVTGNNEVRIKQ